MKVALYVRVSTEDQAKEGFSLAAQLEKLRAFCYSQDWAIYKEYVEEGKSAKNLKRPKLQEMLHDMSYFDVVLVYKLDRLSRSVSDINELLNTFEENKVSFKSATEPYDTTTSQGKLLINIFASLAQFEREQLAERTSFGMHQKIREGKRNGGRAPFGYMLDENNQLAIDEEEAPYIRWLFEAARIRGKKALAVELNKKGVRSRTGTLWNDAMIGYVLNNPVYYGALRWNYRTKKGTRTYEEVVVPGKHEGIISETLFKEIQKKRRDRKNTGFKGHAIYPFSGILKCARCGHNLVGSKRKKADGTYHRYYKCTGKGTYRICDMPVLAEDTIEQEFINSLEYVHIDIEHEEEQLDIKSLEKELKRVEGRIERLEELYIEGDISKKKYREKLEIEQEKETALRQSLESSHEIITPDAIHAILNNLKTDWLLISLEKRKEIIHQLFDKITVECLQSHKGGLGERPIIEFKEVSLNF